MVSIPYKRVTNGKMKIINTTPHPFQSPISGSQTVILRLISRWRAEFQSPISGSQTTHAGVGLAYVKTFQSPISGSQTGRQGEVLSRRSRIVSIPYKRVTNRNLLSLLEEARAGFQSPISGSQTYQACGFFNCLRNVSIPYKRVTNKATCRG